MHPFLWVTIAVVVLIFVSKAVFVVRQWERAVVATVGKYVRTAEPGLTFVLPFFQTLTRVDMRETVMEVMPQEVITKDNVVIRVDAVIYYEVTDPFRRSYNVTNFQVAAIKLAQTNLRNIIGDMELDAALTSRERINTQLRTILDEATDKWGVRVTRVELQAIEPPKDINEAMSRQMKAERGKRAAILEAEGLKQSQILKAEGTRQSAILQAEGQAEAIKKVAEAEKFRQSTVAEGEGQAIQTVFAAIHTGQPTHDLLAVRYLETLGRIADGKATKIFMPYEASGILSGIAAAGVAFEEGRKSADDVPTSEPLKVQPPVAQPPPMAPPSPDTEPPQPK